MTYVTVSNVMSTDLGRPRDRRIDESTLRAAVELLGVTGYAGLSMDAVARVAGTSKPAIYRRWPSKAHLVHEAVFPVGDATTIPDTGVLADDVRDMVRGTAAVLGTPAARAALPGLIAEMASDPSLHSALLERFSDVLFGGLGRRLENACARGEVRTDVTTADLVEVLAGTTLMALLTRPAEIDDQWTQRIATLLMKGISV